jgi:putative transposase
LQRVFNPSRRYSFWHRNHLLRMGIIVLGWFGKGMKQARSRYHDFIKEGVSMGKRPELTGGGLVRSVGGWLNLMQMLRAKVFVKGDERILGEAYFFV